MEEVIAQLIPSATIKPRAPLFSFFSMLLRMQVMEFEKDSQGAVSFNAEDGWTSAKWRIMLMFVPIKCKMH